MQERNREKRMVSQLPEGEVSEHLPEWVQLFGELQDEAEEAYPDGRLRVIIPRRWKRHGGENLPS